ncbi:MAG: hypothetical protein KAT01_06800 [Candidatus Aminicenantes bacterium]|nr:hypothetical protein [Candidatus Aminicenantes bacterium]
MYNKIQIIKTSELLNTLSIWNRFLKRRVHLIACGGTALTLINLKESTIDIDLLIPKPDEYKYLIKTLIDLGYEQKTGTGWQKDRGFRFDLFPGNKIFITELLESPLDKGNHILFKEFSSIYLGILNYYDLIISKLFRFTPVDREDCLTLILKKSDEIDLEHLKSRFFETSSYDISDEKHKKNFELFLRLLQDKKTK